MAKSEDLVVAKELRERSEAELRSLLLAKQDELHQVKFKKALGQLNETHTVKVLKRDIARLHTVLKEQARKEQQA